MGRVHDKTNRNPASGSERPIPGGERKLETTDKGSKGKKRPDNSDIEHSWRNARGLGIEERNQQGFSPRNKWAQKIGVPIDWKTNHDGRNTETRE